MAPRIHDLVRMANMAKIKLGEETLKFLDAVNTFNISTRYPDEKLKFYKLCTAEFTEKYFRQIKEIYKCLLQKITH
ncbi:MAG: HEPN domain-containing protein [Desulfobacula sp.]|nr:HEPN domain-containing protein [Desulfobacula sp.]